jgi:uncharacterized protein YkwD
MLKTSQAAVALVVLLGVAAVPPSSRLAAAADGNASGEEKSGQVVTLKRASAASPEVPFSDYDAESESVLLYLANQARAQIGAPLLTVDSGMSRAARAHAAAMLAARQLSHQFDGEPSLPQRLAAATLAQLDQEGENVALDFDAEKGHQHLMLSPPHRANLLNPAYNVVGLGVVRSGNRLYIVQDFGHALPNYSIDKVKELIAAAVEHARREANRSGLGRHDLPIADNAACSMAQADKLATLPVHQLAQRYTVISYTNLHPETLPENAGPTLHSPNLRSFSVGACYARSETYPAGAYWVVLSLE